MDLIPAPRLVTDCTGDDFFVLGPYTVLAAGPGTERA